MRHILSGRDTIRYLPENETARFEHENPEHARARRLLRPRYDIVRQLISLRWTLDLTQQELAKRSKTHPSRISKIESAEYDMRLSTLAQIAEGLEADLLVSLKPRLEEGDLGASFRDSITDYYARLLPSLAGDKPTYHAQITRIQQKVHEKVPA